MIKKHLSSIRLGTALLIISIVSLFIGVMDIDLKALLSGGNGMELNIFLLSRIPRLLASFVYRCENACCGTDHAAAMHC